MKLLLLCLCSLFLSVPAMSQNLSIDTLLKLRKMKDPEAVHRKLSNKGWTMMSDMKPTNDLTGVAVLGYKPVDGKAHAWVSLFYSYEDSRVNVIQYNPNCNCAMRTFESAVRVRRTAYWNSGEYSNGEQTYSYKAFYDKEYVVRLLTYPAEENRIGMQIFNVNYYFSTIEGKGYL